MTSYFLFVVAYYWACVLFFEVVQRPLFILYNRRSNLEKLTFGDLRRIYYHGFKTDLIIAAYLSVIPMLAASLQAIVPGLWLGHFMTAFNLLFALIVGLLVVADTALYEFWQYKIDSSALAYLRSLRGTFASVSAGYIATAALAVVLVGSIYYGLVTAATGWLVSAPYIAQGWGMKLLAALTGILLTGVGFLIVRGLGRRPHNPSLSFYSKNLFYNHCALNPFYSFIYSLSVQNRFSDQFRAFDDERCERLFAPLFPTSGTPQTRLLNTTRPNVLFVVWESLCARFVESLGGMPDVTPNLDRLAREGVLFTRVDAGSFRTDRGLVCLLSGYLGQPTTSIIRMTRKLPNLPALPRVFKNAGYDTTVLHGGDLTIFHKSDYYLTIGHDTLVTENDFPASAPRCKWGVHDGITMEWLYEDIMRKTAEGKRWYTTYQTLSSHETFEVPYDRLLPQDEIANSFAYVDDCFGRLVDRLKASPAWKDLLIVCVGDHGCNSGEPLTRSKYPHIPIVLLGGAVSEPRTIDTIMSQSDLAATLLGQLDLPHGEFTFSRDVLADTYTYPFSFHTYNNGFLFRDATGYTNYDNVSNSPLEGADPRREELGRAILQRLYEDLDKR